MSKLIIQNVSCDVLCIGGSGAAVSAAYMAGKKNKKVILVSKGKAGRSGNAIMVGGGFGIDGYNSKYTLGQSIADESYTPDMLMGKIIKSSFFLSDQKLVNQFVTDAPYILKEFLTWAKHANQKIFFVKSGLFAVSGNSMGKTISQGIRETDNLEIFNDVMVIDLIINDNCVIGAIGLNIYTGEYIHFRSKSVVIATGGYQPYSLKNTISDMTGDGMAMILRAGGKIADMEFLLFIPTAVFPNYIKGSILPYLFTIPFFMPLKYKVIDSKGNELNIPEDFSSIPPSNKSMKLIYHYFWSKKSCSDPMKGGLFFDYSMNTDEEIKMAFKHFTGHYSQWHKEGMYNGINLNELKEIILANRKLEFALGNEYSNGGIVINEKMSTNIEGLYAAGEVTSGLFGAFRAGDGLSEMLAQGYRAGIEASKYADKVKNVKNSNNSAKKIIDSIEEIFQNSGNISSIHLFNLISKYSDNGFGIVRNENGLQSSLQKIEYIENNQLNKVKITNKSRLYNLDLYYYLQLRNLILCVKAGLLAALKRKESRGTHLRNDYCEVNNKYLYRISSYIKNGKMLNGEIIPDTSFIKPPEKNFDSVAQYLKEILMK